MRYTPTLTQHGNSRDSGWVARVVLIYKKRKPPLRRKDQVKKYFGIQQKTLSTITDIIVTDTRADEPPLCQYIHADASTLKWANIVAFSQNKYTRRLGMDYRRMENGKSVKISAYIILVIPQYESKYLCLYVHYNGLLLSR